MNIRKPNEQFTVYSKIDCKNCWIVKRVLEIEQHRFEVIDCDNYLIENRQEFLTQMRQIMKLTEDKRIFFPIVFYNGMYLEDPLEFIDGIRKDDQTFF